MILLKSHLHLAKAVYHSIFLFVNLFYLLVDKYFCKKKPSHSICWAIVKPHTTKFTKMCKASFKLFISSILFLFCIFFNFAIFYIFYIFSILYFCLFFFSKSSFPALRAHIRNFDRRCIH